MNIRHFFPQLLFFLIFSTTPFVGHATDDMMAWTTVELTWPGGDPVRNLNLPPDQTLGRYTHTSMEYPGYRRPTLNNLFTMGFDPYPGRPGVYKVFSTSLSAPDTAQIIRDIVFILNDFATVLVPGINWWADRLVSAAYSLTTPGSGQNLLGGLPGGNAAGIADIYKLAVDLGKLGDKSITETALLTLDQSDVYDTVKITFRVNTVRGDPLAWLRTAPIASSYNGQGILKNAQGEIAMKTSPIRKRATRNGLPMDAEVDLFIYPKKMPVGKTTLIFSAKEGKCTANCLSTYHTIQLKIVRSCNPEGMARVSPPSHIPFSELTNLPGYYGCKSCGPLQKLVSEGSCGDCPAGSIGNFQNKMRTTCTACSEVAFNSIPAVNKIPVPLPNGILFYTETPFCKVCGQTERPNWNFSACVPQGCRYSEIGQPQVLGSDFAVAGIKSGDCHCLNGTTDGAPAWRCQCRSNQMISGNRCVDCPRGFHGDPATRHRSCIKDTNMTPITGIILR